MKPLAVSLFVMLSAAPAAGAADKGTTAVTWYGHSAFVVKTPKGTVLAIDPWLSNPADPDKEAVAKLARVDFILVTHGHFDHVGDAIDIAKRTGAKLVAGFDLSRALVRAGYPKDQATMMTAGNIGGTIPLAEDISVTIVPAVHSSDFRKDDASPIEPGGNPVGFVLHVQGGPTIYHTGDTDVTSDMKLVGDRWHPDLMLACIGGQFTMDPAGAALAAMMVRPKRIVPMHFGTIPLMKGTPAALEKELKARGSKATVIEMKAGETRMF
jgi:L-ascorbate metabolism protein UlaG (beta-lactamase superfamily)